MHPSCPSPLSLAGRRFLGLLALVVAGALAAVDVTGAVALVVHEEEGRSRARWPVSPPAEPSADPPEAAADPPEAAADPPQAAADPPVAADAPAGRAAGPSGGAEGADPAASPSQRMHVVAPGETPGAIAEQHGVPTRALTLANRHVSARSLQPGARLVVPDPAAPRPGTPEEAMAADLPLEGLLEEVAEAHGWNPAVVKAIAWVESRWDHQVISDRGAIGVMQVQPATGQLVSERIGRQLDLHDQRDNVEAGVAYLDELHERYGSDTRALLAAYHQGPRAVRDHGIYRVSDRYADAILHLREVFRP